MAGVTAANVLLRPLLGTAGGESAHTADEEVPGGAAERGGDFIDTLFFVFGTPPFSFAVFTIAPGSLPMPERERDPDDDVLCFLGLSRLGLLSLSLSPSTDERVRID